PRLAGRAVADRPGPTRRNLPQTGLRPPAADRPAQGGGRRAARPVRQAPRSDAGAGAGREGKRPAAHAITPRPGGVSAGGVPQVAGPVRGSPAAGGQAVKDDDVVVEAHGLTKVYGTADARVDALRGVDLAVRRGEFVAVMGPSGSGKSTLLHLIGG